MKKRDRSVTSEERAIMRELNAVTPAECYGGPLDGRRLDVPWGRALVVLDTGAEYKTRKIKLVRSGYELPKRWRDDEACLGHYSRTQYRTDDAMHGREVYSWKAKGRSRRDVPGWMLNASDIERYDERPDPADDWKRGTP